MRTEPKTGEVGGHRAARRCNGALTEKSRLTEKPGDPAFIHGAAQFQSMRLVIMAPVEPRA